MLLVGSVSGCRQSDLFVYRVYVIGLKLTVGQVLRAVQQKANKEEVMSIITQRFGYTLVAALLILHQRFCVEWKLWSLP
jgi:hypothetical protein